MMRTLTALRDGRSPAVLAAGATLFAVVFALQAIVTTPGFGITLLYDIPVALIAVAYGTRAGLLAATVGIVLYFGGQQLFPTHINGVAVRPQVAGYVSRAVVFYLLGGLLGMYSNRLRRVEARTGRFFELSVDLVCTADTNGCFVDLNPAWEKTLGYSEAELRSKPYVEFVHPDDREATVRERERIFAGGITHEYQNRYLAKDGTVHWLRWSAVFSSEDQLIFARATDVTERRQLAEMRRQAAEALERSNAELKHFASIASHDLAEPLRTIGGFAQLLEKRYEDKVDDQGRDYIRRMVGGVERLQNLIEDLLAFSRAGRREIDPEPVDCSELVEEIVLDLKGSIDEHHADVDVGKLPTVPADPHQLHQVFQNLISNALKFQNGSGERPRVEISARRNDGEWQFSVADNGIGIEPEHREKIFGPFHRLHGRDQYWGNGIGLAICQRIVERHGGQIHVEDGADGGSTFIFTIADQ